MKKNRRGKNRRGIRGGISAINRSGGRGAGPSSRNSKSPARASPSPVVGGAQGGSAAGGSYSQIAKRGIGGDGDGAVVAPSTCASYMADHGKVQYDELPARPDVMGKKKGDKFWGDFMYLAHGNLAVAGELKMKAEAKAAAEAEAAAIGKTAAAAVASKTTAAINAGSSAAVDAAPAAKMAVVAAVDTIRPTATGSAPEAAEGVPRAAAVMVAAEAVAAAEMAVVAPAVAVDAGSSAAVDAAPAAKATVEAVGAGLPTVAGTVSTSAGCVAVEVAAPVVAAPVAAAPGSCSNQAPATGAAPANAGMVVVEVAAGTSTNQAGQPAAIDASHTGEGKVEGAIVAASTCRVPAADVRRPASDVIPVAQGGAVAVGTAGDKGEPVAGEIAAAAEQGVPAMVAVFAEAAIDADEVPAAAVSAVETDTGGAAAGVAVAVAATVAADDNQGKTKNAAPVVSRGPAKAEEAAGDAPEASPLSAAAGNGDWLAYLLFVSKIFTGVWAVVAVFILLECFQYADPSRRGSTLSPGDRPLLPGEYIEGSGGSHKFGWIPGLRWKPKLVISPEGEMIAQRRDGSEVVLAGANAGHVKENVGLLCRGERLLRRVAHVAAPEYGARSQQGRLLLGREHFCSMDASPVTVSTVDVARLWLKGGGVLGFSDDGDIEMVASSGQLVWSLAQDQNSVEISETWRMSKTDKGELAETQREAARKQIENMEQDRQQRAKDFKRRQKERSEEKRKERDDAKRNKKRRRTKSFDPKVGAARDAVNDIASPSSESTPPRDNIFVRVLSWARQPSPKGAGGQSG